MLEMILVEKYPICAPVRTSLRLEVSGDPFYLNCVFKLLQLCGASLLEHLIFVKQFPPLVNEVKVCPPGVERQNQEAGT